VEPPLIRKVFSKLLILPPISNKMSTPKSHRIPFMEAALIEAQKAASRGEVPVGCVAVCNNQIIASNHNRREETGDPGAHAEILVLREVGRKKNRWNLSDTDLYVTLEPCPMCAGAIVNSRISTLVYGADDPKRGGVRSLYAICEDPRLNHQCLVVPGILKDRCAQVLSNFFQELRKS
jgi:tRNA(adenine34) deaminase